MSVTPLHAEQVRATTVHFAAGGGVEQSQDDIPPLESSQTRPLVFDVSPRSSRSSTSNGECHSQGQSQTAADDQNDPAIPTAQVVVEPPSISSSWRQSHGNLLHSIAPMSWRRLPSVLPRGGAAPTSPAPGTTIFGVPGYLQKGVYGVLHDYHRIVSEATLSPRSTAPRNQLHHQRPEGEADLPPPTTTSTIASRLLSGLQSALTMMLMDSDVVSSMDFPSIRDVPIGNAGAVSLASVGTKDLGPLSPASEAVPLTPVASGAASQLPTPSHGAVRSASIEETSPDATPHTISSPGAATGVVRISSPNVNPAAQAVFAAPHCEALRSSRRKVEEELAESVSVMHRDELERCYLAAHSALAVIADWVGSCGHQMATPSAAASLVGTLRSSLAAPSFSVGSRLASHKVTPRGGLPPTPNTAGFPQSGISFTLTNESASAAPPSGGRGAGFVLENVTMAQSVAVGLGGKVDQSFSVGPSQAQSFFCQSQHVGSGPHGGDSVASQFLEPVHETGVAHRTVDDLGMKMLNNYMLLETIGQGACGKVKLGFDVEKSLSVAIKVVRRPFKSHRLTSQSAAQQRLDSLRQEIAVMKKLRHKNIVSLYEVIDDPEAEKLYLVMQYIDDGPIRRVQDDFTCDRIPPNQFAGLARQVCAGLEYLHSRGFVHRDIKPENILVSSSRQVYLADFGVTDVLGPQHQCKDDGKRRRRSAVQNAAAGVAKTHKGTPMFMAPEIWQVLYDEVKETGEVSSPLAMVKGIGFSGNSAVDHDGGCAPDRRSTAIPEPATLAAVDTAPFTEDVAQADDNDDGILRQMSSDEFFDGFALDIWALGVTFYMLLVGKAPFALEKLQRSDVADLTFPPEAGVPQEWETLIRRMLDQKPHKRPKINLVRSAVKRIDKAVTAKEEDEVMQKIANSFRLQNSQRGASQARLLPSPATALLDTDDVAAAFTPRVRMVGDAASATSPIAEARRAAQIRGFQQALASQHAPPSRISSVQFTPGNVPLGVPIAVSNHGSHRSSFGRLLSPRAPHAAAPATPAESTLGGTLMSQNDVCTIPVPPSAPKPVDSSPKPLRNVGIAHEPKRQSFSNMTNETADTALGLSIQSSSVGTIPSQRASVVYTSSRGGEREAVVVDDAETFDV